MQLEGLDSIAVTRDGRLLAGATFSGGHARVWDVAARTLVAERRFDELLEDLTFSPDGSMLAIGGSADAILIWVSAITPTELIHLSTRPNDRQPSDPPAAKPRDLRPWSKGGSIVMVIGVDHAAWQLIHSPRSLAIVGVPDRSDSRCAVPTKSDVTEFVPPDDSTRTADELDTIEAATGRGVLRPAGRAALLDRLPPSALGPHGDTGLARVKHAHNLAHRSHVEQCRSALAVEVWRRE